MQTRAGQARTELVLEIIESHLRPGTSKWNRIEHHLFAQISMNWRGRPLTSREVIIEAASATTHQDRPDSAMRSERGGRKRPLTT